MTAILVHTWRMTSHQCQTNDSHPCHNISWHPFLPEQVMTAIIFLAHTIIAKSDSHNCHNCHLPCLPSGGLNLASLGRKLWRAMAVMAGEKELLWNINLQLWCQLGGSNRGNILHYYSLHRVWTFQLDICIDIQLQYLKYIRYNILEIKAYCSFVPSSVSTLSIFPCPVRFKTLENPDSRPAWIQFSTSSTRP